jgi:hypothetical protein
LVQGLDWKPGACKLWVSWIRELVQPPTGVHRCLRPLATRPQEDSAIESSLAQAGVGVSRSRGAGLAAADGKALLPGVPLPLNLPPLCSAAG